MAPGDCGSVFTVVTMVDMVTVDHVHCGERGTVFIRGYRGFITLVVPLLCLRAAGTGCSMTAFFVVPERGRSL